MCATVQPPPITKVVLYKHGMGYLEREGKIKDDATLSLAFRTEQMKDLLTSFFAVDLGGGRILRQDETSDPLSKQLGDILLKAPQEADASREMPVTGSASLRSLLKRWTTITASKCR